jgi:membrane protease YdiL (CAAX protease family)
VSERASGVRRFVADHQLAVFFVLACALAWWPALLIDGVLLGVGPTLAALFVLSLVHGPEGVRGLLRQIVKWRISWWWYALAVGLPTVAAVVAAWVTVLLGAPRPTAEEIGAWPSVFVTFVLLLVVPLLGPWEEPGFRGFALSRLMLTRSPLVAGLLVAVLHAFWHLPLFVTGNIPPADVVLVLAAGVVFAWLVVGSGGSVLVAMVMHAASNAVSGEYISPMFDGADADTLGWIRAAIWCLFAVGAVLAGGRAFRSVEGSVGAGEQPTRPA